MQQGEILLVDGKPVGEGHDDGEDHGGGAYYGGADQYRLRRGLEGVACAVIGFEQVFGALEVDGHVEILLDFGFDVSNLLDQGEFVDGLSVIGNRAVRVDCDGDRAHAQKSKSHQAKCEYWSRNSGGQP